MSRRASARPTAGEPFSSAGVRYWGGSTSVPGGFCGQSQPFVSAQGRDPGAQEGVSRPHSSVSSAPGFHIPTHSCSLAKITPCSVPTVGLRNQGVLTPLPAKGSRAFQPNWESLPQALPSCPSHPPSLCHSDWISFAPALRAAQWCLQRLRMLLGKCEIT